MSKQPPRCPDCGKPLDKVDEVVYEEYTFNPKTGMYSTDHWNNSMDIKCTKCGADLRDVFTEGACNYLAS